MKESEFDKFAEEYRATLEAGVAISGEGADYFSEYKIRDIARALDAQVGDAGRPAEILDFGAGIGNSVPFVARYFPEASITCLDPSARSLEIAEGRFPGSARYLRLEGDALPFPDDHFDIAFAMCVFHHIDHGEHEAVLAELFRALRPGGSLFVFEHNPLNPLTVRIVDDCPFDENAHLIGGREMKRRVLRGGFKQATLSYRVFFPHALRGLRPLERALTWLPLGGQYYVHARK